MAFKFDKSSEGYENNLALFTAPPFETATLKKQWQHFRPVTQLSKGATVHFTIHGTSSDYINLRETRLYLKCRINKPDGTRIAKEDNTGFVNMPLSSLIRQADVSLNQNLITPSVGLNYPYKAMFDTLLKFDEESKETQLQGALYYKDTPKAMDACDAQTGGNLGLIERSSWTENGQSVDLEGPIYMDICQQKRLIMNGVQIDIKLYPHSDAFALMSASPDKKYQYEIENAISYLSTFTGTGKYLENDGNYITRQEFRDGYTIYAYDTDGKDFLNLIKKGHTRLSIRFQTPTKDIVCVLVYRKTPAILEIDESRNILK